MNKEERIDFISQQILYHNECYFEGRPEITDTEYDGMVRELQSLAPDHATLSEVGAEVSYGTRVEHSIVMGSLDKAYSYEEIAAWLAKNGFGPDTEMTLSLKIDGLALRNVYEKGKLVLSATRGNGFIGRDVTDNVKVIKSIPNTVSEFSGEVRGEAYMTNAVFDRLVSEGHDFAVSRSAASGSLNQKDTSVTADRELDFFAYDVIPDDDVFATQVDKEVFAEKLGFSFVKLKVITLAQVQGAIDAVESKRASLPFKIDGLVFAVNDIDAFEAAGRTGKCPNGAISYKFAAEQKETPLLDINWQVGRTGRVTPVAKLKTVVLDGSKVTNPTLHNIGRIRAWDITIGCDVLVEKAGDIIPQVCRVTKPVKYNEQDWKGLVNYPTLCPSCETETIDDDTTIWCVNPACPAQLDEMLLNWVRAIDIKGVGDKNISILREAGLLKSIPDFYRLTVEDVQKVTGGERSAQVIVEALMTKKNIPLAEFLRGLGITNLGNTNGKLFAKTFKTLAAVRALTEEQFLAIEGVGTITSKRFAEGLKNLSDMIDELLTLVDVEEVVEVIGSLTGKSFCITGALSRKKKEVYKDIEAAGGEAWSSVKKGLTYLIQANPNESSAKSKKALKLGVEVISEEQVEEMLK